jgi:hypothetical protein
MDGLRASPLPACFNTPCNLSYTLLGSVNGLGVRDLGSPSRLMAVLTRMGAVGTTARIMWYRSRVKLIGMLPQLRPSLQYHVRCAVVLNRGDGVMPRRQCCYIKQPMSKRTPTFRRKSMVHFLNDNDGTLNFVININPAEHQEAKPAHMDVNIHPPWKKSPYSSSAPDPLEQL